MTAAVPILRDHIAESLAGNPEAIRMQMGQHEEIVTELRTRNTLLQKLHYRELSWALAIIPWILKESDELVFDLEGKPLFLHSLIENESYEKLAEVVRLIVGGSLPRYICEYCKDVRCGGEQQCAAAADTDHILRVRMPKEVKRAIERLVEVRRWAGEVGR